MDVNYNSLLEPWQDMQVLNVNISPSSQGMRRVDEE